MAKFTAPRVVVEGVDPRGVFKIKAKTRLKIAQRRGLTLLGDTTDWTYFVVPDDPEASALRAELDTYIAGKATTALAEFFGSFETIEAYGPADRRDPRLPDEISPDGLRVDVALWPAAKVQDALNRVGDVQRIARQFDCPIVSKDTRALTPLVRLVANTECLDALLELMVVEKVKALVAPFLEPSDWLNVDANSLTHDEPLDVTIGIIDDGVNATHPLLRELIVDSTAFPADHEWAPITTHGTLVAGLSAFGDFESALRAGTSLPQPAHLAVARVLEEDPANPGSTHFPSPKPNHVVIEDAVRHLRRQGARIINLSITDPDAFAGPHVSLWTETVDRLCRELDIVIIVAAGNRGLPLTGAIDDTTHVHHDYPKYLHQPANRIAEPGVAAIAVTVGSVARSGASSFADGRSVPDNRVIAHEGEVSPFSRTGPGAHGTTQLGAIKPEFVHYGGNSVWTGTNTVDHRDYGAAIISTAQSPAGRLFALASGTSFAAPRVARVAAEILADRPEASSNLVRALLGTSARDASHQFEGAEQLLASGFGIPDAKRAISSDLNRVLLVHEGVVETNGAMIHPIPMPPDFVVGKADRTLRVSIASDPPVRRQRREYTGGHIGLDLYRNVTLDEVESIVRKQDPKNKVAKPTGRNIKALVPGPQMCAASTLQVRRWDAPSATSFNPDDGEVYYLVVKHYVEDWATRLTDVYTEQRYALVVEFEDRERTSVNLYALLQAQIQEINERIRATVAERVRLGTR